MAGYLLLLYEDETAWASASEATAREVYSEHVTFGEANRAAVSGGNALAPSDSATSVRRAAPGEFDVTDGPFFETKEALGGYYLIEAADLDEAIAIAKQVPARFGGVEVRPIRVFD
jgi:hypothetical protein